MITKASRVFRGSRPRDLAAVVCCRRAPLSRADRPAHPLFVGEEKIVEGVVTAVDKDVNIVTLQLGTPPHTLAVSVVIGLLTRFPTNPEVYYAGKTVRVAGTIEKFRDAVEMTIRDPSNIEVVDFEAARREDPKLREEQEAMRARVKSLEERIRQLEAGQQQQPQADPPTE
jgi:hypothetical protein